MKVINTMKVARWADDEHWYQPWPFFLGWLFVATVETFREWRMREETQSFTESRRSVPWVILAFAAQPLFWMLLSALMSLR